MKRTLPAAFAALIFAAGCASLEPKDEIVEGDLGVLVMAHGGGEAWNGEVRDMLAPVAGDYPLKIAFGMADAVSLQEAVDELEDRGVERIAVVRLFVSGESWYERTEQILGLAPGAPPRSAAASGHDAHADHGMRMEFWRLDSDSSFALSTEGLAEAPEMGGVLVERVRALSTEPRAESVLILAHGPGDDGENQRWIESIDARADAVRRAAPFRRVEVQTLREDWPDKREEAEARVRAFVSAAAADGGRALVIPYRVQGFGPYAEVLEGLSYEADGQGLLPSVEVERWVRRQIEELREAEYRAPQPPEERDVVEHQHSEHGG